MGAHRCLLHHLRTATFTAIVNHGSSEGDGETDHGVTPQVASSDRLGFTRTNARRVVLACE